MRRKISVIMATAMLTSTLYGTGAVWVESSTYAMGDRSASLAAVLHSTSGVSKFDLWGSSLLSAYDQVFKLDRANMASISNNGSNWSTSTLLANAIDGNTTTRWLSGQANSASFKNEIISHLIKRPS